MTKSESLGEGDLIANRYRLERHLGRGGMGTVWLATDAELDELPVAIKMIRPELAGDAQFISGLKAEAKSSLALTHPHIVRVFNLHRDDNDPDLTFLVLKYIEGETMKQLLAGSPQGLAPERVLKWAGQIAAALDYAHSAGVLHRDIKPSNVMIDASSDTAYLMDFGISRQLGATMAKMDTGSSVGTPAYMSPQQLHEKDCTSNDIYSFAATVYEALCGRPPFGGADLEEQILRVHAKPIPGIDDNVNDGLLAGLAKTEEDRPATAAELVEWMKTGVPGTEQEVQAPMQAPTPTHQMESSETRSGLPIGAIAAGLVLVAGFAAGRTSRIANPIRDLFGLQTASAQPGPVVDPPAPVITPDPLGHSEQSPQPVANPTPLIPEPEPIEWARDDAPRFIEMVRKGQTAAVREALNSAADSDTVTDLLEASDPNTGYAPIHEAASQGNDPMVRMLVGAGARVDQTAGLPLNLTPLHIAARSKHRSTVELLLTFGAQVDAEAGGGNTPLHLVAEQSRNPTDLELIELLLKAGADRSLMNNKGKTPAELVPLTSKVRGETLALLQP
jgi:serine/threonine protein kinase